MSHMAKFISDFASTIQEIDNAAMEEGAEKTGSKSRLKKWNRRMLQNFQALAQLKANTGLTDDWKELNVKSIQLLEPMVREVLASIKLTRKANL